MRLLFLGDVVGRDGRAAVFEHLPGLRARLKADFVVVNAENAASGFGLTKKIADSLFEAGADALTLGNHAFDQKEILGVLDDERRIIRPLNWPRTPGKGANLFTTPSGARVLVANLLGRIFMTPLDDPFSAVDALLRAHPLGKTADAIIIDIHAEATSEKMAMGHWCDGRASLVVGTHTHVPTADTMILPKGCAYQSDAGMCGVYDSVIGMDKTEPIKRFIVGMSARPEPARGPATVSGVFVETNDETGLAKRVEPVRIGGPLSAAEPKVDA